MSDELADSVPEGEDAAHEVPSETSAVDDASSGEKTVPAERFNGLMRKNDQLVNELSASRETLAEALKRIEALESAKPQVQENNTNMADAELESKVDAVLQMLASERADKATKSVFEKFPEAAPFKEMFVASSEEDLFQAVEQFTERLKSAGYVPGETGTPSGEQEVDQEPKVAPPVLGVGVEGSSSSAEQNQADAAVAEAKKTGSLSVVFKALVDRANAKERS